MIHLLRNGGGSFFSMEGHSLGRCISGIMFSNTKVYTFSYVSYLIHADESSHIVKGKIVKFCGKFSLR